MVRTKLKMNSDLKEAFSKIKPICDVLMVCPSLESLSAYSARVNELKKEVVQELQQYLLYPLISRIKCNEIRHKVEMHIKLLDAVCTVLEKITVNSYEMFMKLETGLLGIIFDSTKPGMVSDASEDVKHSTVRCLTVLMLNIPREFREKLLTNHVPMLAQAVFVCVHIAKMERLRVLRLSSIHCIMAHTMTHPELTVEYHITDKGIEALAVEQMLSSILPGVLAALQDVCTCTNNPTHTVVAAAIEAIHRILCVTMHDKYLAKKPVTTADFVNMLTEKKAQCETEVSSDVQPSPKDVEKRSEEWFMMAGEKLTLITKSLVSLRLHEHFKVRKELAIFCYRILTECSLSMSDSIPLCLDVLISLTKDPYPEVSSYCSTAVQTYFSQATDYTRQKTMDSLCDNFISLCTTLPRVLNNIDDGRKLSALSLLHGYIEALCSGRPQRLTAALSVAHNMQLMCDALATAAQHDTHHVTLTRRIHTGVLTPPPAGSPWSQLCHVSSPAAGGQLRRSVSALGGAECAELVLDVLLDRLRLRADVAHLCLLNWMIAAPESTESMASRMLDAYISDEIWYLPIEVGSTAVPLTSADTYDVTVYNPRAWHTESVPDLYEGTVSTRYTELSLHLPRAHPPRDPRRAATPAQGRRHLVMSCLTTEGVGVIARRLGHGYQLYLLKTLCLVLERVGSEYELLHLAGLKTLHEIAAACGHHSVGDLIYSNADYFIYQITLRLKKAWECQSALQILSVVLEYSDASILDFLYDVVQDVLVQSCDKYYERDLPAYLQAFLTLVERVRLWFPHTATSEHSHSLHFDLLDQVREYVKDTQEAERLLSDGEFEKSCGKTVEEMYQEDMKRKEEDELDYDDKVTEEKQPPPQHVTLTITILKRSIHFITSQQRDIALLALQILSQGLPVLANYEDELLPLVHQTWSPLVERFHSKEPIVLRAALDLLVTLAELAKDFIQARTVKEVLPELYKFLQKSSKDSYLKDTGSAYRSSLAYSVQLRALSALPSLAVALGLADEKLSAAMHCVDPYLSNKQPKPLQAMAVTFFKAVAEYDFAATWYHLRKLCNNDVILEPPKLKYLTLEPIVGSPCQPSNKDYETNVKIIFDFMVS